MWQRMKLIWTVIYMGWINLAMFTVHPPLLLACVVAFAGGSLIAVHFQGWEPPKDKS